MKMKRSLLFYVSALLISVTLFSCKPDDAKIQKQVETALTAIQSTVTPVVKDGVVTLTGTVESEEAKAAAEAALKALKDVKSVVNNVEVKLPVVINPDEVLTTTITSLLTAGGFADVKAAVDSGVVTLTGDLKKADLQKVMQIANEAKPKQVINKLNLK
jgi:osmotically-inducible protein OsmY